MHDSFRLSQNAEKVRQYMPSTREVWGDTLLLRKYLHSAVSKPDFLLKILVVGNSITAGHWCNTGLNGHIHGTDLPPALAKKYQQLNSEPNTCCWSAQLANSLSKLLPNNNFVVMNAGKNGAGIKDNLLALHQFKKTQPHVIILDEALSDTRIDRNGVEDVAKATEEMLDEIEIVFDLPPAVVGELFTVLFLMRERGANHSCDPCRVWPCTHSNWFVYIGVYSICPIRCRCGDDHQRKHLSER
jgi:hypothetical protein